RRRRRRASRRRIPTAPERRSAFPPLLALPRGPHLRKHHHRVECDAQARMTMLTFLLWVLLLVFCWPLALLALVLYPIVWLILLPFRIVGVAVEGVFELLRAIIFL